MLRSVLGVTALVAVLVSFTGPAASAHDWPALGTSTIRQDGPLVRHTLEVAFGRLTDAAHLGKTRPGAEDAELIAFLDARKEKVAAFLSSRLTIDLDGVRCPAELEGMGITWRQGFPYAQVDLVHRCARSAGEFTMRYDLFSEKDGFGADHTSLLDYDLGGGTGRDVFHANHVELRVGGEDGSESAGFFSSVGRHVVLGGEHILHGFDHLLFLVLLLLGSKGWRSVLRLASAFTVAHSVTLALAALGWVDIPANVVEPLIALSIVYVAIETIARRESRHRILVIFGFGLLHGLGFASAMSFTDDFGFRLLASLVSFNVGIELGQLLVVALVFPLLLLARRASWSSFAHASAGAVAGIVGMFWFVERVLLAPGGAG